jgi:NitT/TauT family transport system substrate-binding protein
MKTLIRLLMMGTAALLLVACGGGDSPATESGAAGSAGQATAAVPQTKVTVGYIPILIYAPFFVGIDRGYFAEQGIQVDLQALAGGADMLTQTAAGNFDVGAGGIGSAYFNLAARARELNQGQPIKIVAPLHAERPPLTTPLVVGKKAYDEGRITTIADLKGKKVAINALGAATEYWLERALNAGGLTSKDVEVVAIPFQNIAQALESGAIAGAMLGEPFATLGARQGQVQVLNDRFLDGDQPTAVYYNSAWAAKNPRLAQGFMAAYLKAVRDLENGGWSDPATLAVLSKYTSVSPETISAASRPFGEPDGTVNIVSLQNQQSFFREQGRLTYERPLDIPALIDATYAQEAVKGLGSSQSR